MYTCQCMYTNGFLVLTYTSRVCHDHAGICEFGEYTGKVLVHEHGRAC